MNSEIYIGINLRTVIATERINFRSWRKRWRKGFEIRSTRMNAVVKNIFFNDIFVPFLEESFDLNFPVENNKNSAGKRNRRREEIKKD